MFFKSDVNVVLRLYNIQGLCLDCSRIVKHGTGVTVLLTAESYQFMSGSQKGQSPRFGTLFVALWVKMNSTGPSGTTPLLQ